MQRLTLAAALAAALAAVAAPAAAGDLDLMVGFRTVLAAAIRDDGYNCPDVKDVRELGPDEFGAVLKVTCGPVGRSDRWQERPLRVTAYVEGDFSTRPWGEARRE